MQTKEPIKHRSKRKDGTLVDGNIKTNEKKDKRPEKTILTDGK
jgi:hypothetical protein